MSELEMGVLQSRSRLAKDGPGALVIMRVWTPERMNGRLIRCTECLEMTRDVEADQCPNCEASLPDAPPYW